jgi:hypothetical protein
MIIHKNSIIYPDHKFLLIFGKSPVDRTIWDIALRSEIVLNQLQENQEEYSILKAVKMRNFALDYYTQELDDIFEKGEYEITSSGKALTIGQYNLVKFTLLLS